MNVLVEKIARVNDTYFVIGFNAETFEKVAVKGSLEEVTPILEEFKNNDVAILEIPDKK